MKTACKNIRMKALECEENGTWQHLAPVAHDLREAVYKDYMAGFKDEVIGVRG